MNTAPPAKLWTLEFAALNAINFLSLCNVACFFQFQGYLQGLGFEAGEQGLLISVFALVGLALRPLVSPYLNGGNARRWMFWSVLGVIASLALYNWALDMGLLLAVRLLHGLAYGVLIAAFTARLVAAIPEGKSGQAFGVVGIVTLLPFALLPPLVVEAARLLGGFVAVLNVTAGALLLILPLLWLTPPVGAGQAQERPRWAQIKDNLGQKTVASLLAMSLLVYIAFAPIFYFVETHARAQGLANPGLFYTTVTLTELAVRVLAGRALDRFSKTLLLGWSLALLVAAYLGLAWLPGPGGLLAGAAGLGLGWGMTMPLLGALMFDRSPAHLRGLNANLGFFMFQVGLFVGPLAGGLVLERANFAALSLLCALVCLMSLALLPLAGAPQKTMEA